MDKFRRAINFDLDTKALKKHHPNHNDTKAYREIEKFLLQNGFEHTQYSGYISKNPITEAKLVEISLNLFLEFPWLRECYNSIHTTAVVNTLDLGTLINKKIDEIYEEDLQDQQLLQTNIDEEIEL